MNVSFRDATRQQTKASIVIEGLSGKGKTGLALMIAHALAGDWKKVYCLDTEEKSMDLFDGIRLSTGESCNAFKKFDLEPTHGYRPSNYVSAKESAKRAGALAFVNDSISHMWVREGGILDLVAKLEAANRNVNKFSAWGQPEVTAERQNLFKAVRDTDIHVISTVRLKEKHEMVTTERGSEVKSVGEQQIQMPDLKYEPDLVLRMVQCGSTNGKAPVAKVVKSRYVIFNEGAEYEFTPKLLMQLKEYLEAGADPTILLEQQRTDYINGITSILDANVSKRTMFPMLKESLGYKDTPLTELTIPVLQHILQTLNN